MFAVFGVTTESINKAARKKMEGFMVEREFGGKKKRVMPDRNEWEAAHEVAELVHTPHEHR
ncbi:hypothetical protein LJ739_06945 [Aestuariibacter halophilus]|uniref:Uncharacterized protein n=1 Tax=Fluctibacter halophilus TaxID=226011 RepID=A0ABS8G5U7_9ALTE|nr:hypothetical protein [Aestuariibacter halophilus]MCC2615974.1 hypothetical protein [Aestuariibacter halophilus]